MKKKQKASTAMIPYIILTFVIICALFALEGGKHVEHTLTTGELLEKIDAEEITEMTITPKSSENVYYIEGKLESYKDNESFKAKVISEEISKVTDYAEENDLKKYETNKDPGSNDVLYVILNILPLVVLVGVAYVMFTKLAAGNNKSMDFGRSRAKLSEDGGQVRFTDVAGLKEEKEEVKKQTPEETPQEPVEETPKEKTPEEPKQKDANPWEEKYNSEHDARLRLAAEYDNFRKRTTKEKEQSYGNGKADAVTKMLPIYDNLERALNQPTEDAAYKKGVELTMTELVKIFTGLGVEIFGAPGDSFDPALHNAVMHTEDETAAENTVVEVFQKGYTLGDKILRFAMVKVAN